MKDSEIIKIGVIGLGYWGPNLVRNFSTVPGSKVAMVCDLREERLQIIKKSYPSIEITQNVDDTFRSNFSVENKY